jgi:membrane-bound metal-dependent hydrolase YbcI (DUF457 family)
MFLGHFGIGLGAKKLCPTLPLNLLFTASLLPDLIWSILLLFKIEKAEVIKLPLSIIYIEYSFSHSLLSTFVLALLLGAIYFLIKKKKKESLILSSLVFSHWLLDYIIHISDIPLVPGSSTKVGLGLGQFVLLTALLEGILFLIGAYFYEMTTNYKNNKGKYYLPLLILLLIMLNVFLLLGPTPASNITILWQPLLFLVFIYQAYFIDKNRYVRALN